MILCSYYMTANPSYTYESNKQEWIEQGISELPLGRDTKEKRDKDRMLGRIAKPYTETTSYSF